MVTFISLISGSSGNATYISDGKTNLLIDCGMSGKALKNALARIDVQPENISALLITHEHIDHTKGAGVVSRRYNIPIYATAGTHAAMDVGDIDDANIRIIAPKLEFEIGSIAVTPFSIPHDAAEPVGYSFIAGGEKLSIATDMGHLRDGIREELSGSKYVLLESNHDIDMLRYGNYPYPLKQRILSDVGHLSNELAAKFALQLINDGAEHIMLGHLSKENNTPEVAMLETYNALTDAGVDVGRDVILKVADRYNHTRLI